MISAQAMVVLGASAAAAHDGRRGAAGNRSHCHHRPLRSHLRGPALSTQTSRVAFAALQGARLTASSNEETPDLRCAFH